MNRTLRWTGLAAVVIAVWLLALWIGRGLGTDEAGPPPADVQLIPYYIVDDTRQPRFRLLGGERELKLVTHAIADTTDPVDPGEVVIYGVRLTLTDLQGEVIWSGQLHTSGRRSVDVTREVDGRPALPDAWLPDEDERPVFDSRVLQFRIPRRIPAESRLTVTGIGDVREIAVRLYAREAPRGGMRSSLRFRAADLLVDDGPPIDDMLAERVPRDLRWVRRTSESQTRTIARTGFRVPFDENEARAYIPIDPLRPLALNVEGPADMTLEVKRGVDATTALTMTAGSIDVMDVAEIESIGGLSVPVPDGPDAVTIRRFSVGPGVHSLHVHTGLSGGARVRLTSAAGQPRQIRFGDVPRVEYDDEELVLTDERRFPVFVAGPDDPPVRVTIEGPDDDLARLIRLDTRLVWPTPVGPTTDPETVKFGEATLDVVWRDEQGREIGRRALTVSPPRAPFEEIEEVDGQRRKVSEPQGLRLAAPAGARTLEVRADERLTVRPHVLFPAPPPHLDLPYREHLPEEMIWRYAPRAFRIWYPIAPENREALRAADAVLTLISQVRLVPRGLDPEKGDARTPPREFDPIFPIGRPAQQRVLEDVRSDRVGALRREFPPGLLAAVPLKTDVAFTVRRGDRARPRLRVRTTGDEAAVLGKSLEVFVDGKRRTAMRIGSTGFAVSLPSLKAGQHTVRVVSDAPADALAVYIDRPTRDTALFHQRTLYELNANGLDLDVPVPDAGVSINAIVYDRRTEAVPGVTLIGRIDDGRPRRRRGVPVDAFTLPESMGMLPAARRPLTKAVLVDRVNETAGYARTFPVRLGPDLTRGVHRLRFRARADRVLWVRFIIADELMTDRESVRVGTFVEAE